MSPLGYGTRGLWCCRSSGALVETTVSPESTPFASACSQITSDLEASTPSSDASASYRRVRGEGVLGATGYRDFWFEWINFQVEGSRGKQNWTVQHNFRLRIRLHGGGKLFEERPNAIQADGIIIMRKVNRREAWPAGVETVQIDRAGVEVKGKDAILILNGYAHTQEVTP